MEELEFSRREVEELVDKLVSYDLSERERALLLTIFWAAAELVSPALPRASSDLTELREQLANSFLPDTGDEFIIRPRPKRNGP
jgi:hypothetical protein